VIIPHQNLQLQEFKRVVQSAWEDLYRWITVGNTGIVNIRTDPPEHADNAAALAASLKIGDVYRTGDDLKIVHS
jgi:hypothetical protein